MPEKTLWKGSPSQWTNFSSFIMCTLFCWLIFPIFIALYVFLKTRCTEIEITSERLIIKEGIFSKIRHQLEFYRIKDVVLEEPFILRLSRLSDLIFISTDMVESFAPIKGVPDGQRLQEEIRAAIEEVRKNKNVAMMDH